MNITKVILDLTLLSGPQWIMYLLLILSILTLTIIIERLLFFRRYRGNFEKFLLDLNNKINSSEPLDKIMFWVSKKRLLEAEIIKMSLEKSITSIKAFEETIHSSILVVKNRLEKSAILLATLATITPFIGLLGTIIGIVEAFHSLSLGAGRSGPQLVMKAISEALVVTALGLFVAIPAAASYNFLTRYVRKKITNCEVISGIMITYLEKSKESKNEKA